MRQNSHLLAVAVCLSLTAVWSSFTPAALAVDCNANGVEDALDITNATSQDCDVNTVPDECQPDTNANGTIDACDTCGAQLTDDALNQSFSTRQSNAAQGKVLWLDDQDAVSYFDGNTAVPIQPRVVNNVDLDAVFNFVFALGTGAAPGQVLGGWRRGSDFAWVWSNNGQPPVQVQYTQPYDPNLKMNPEGIAIADGCIFIAFQARDPATNVLILHVYKIDPATGASTLLTGDFLNDTQNQGNGADPLRLLSSGCKAAWRWCRAVVNASCVYDLHVYDGTSVKVIDSNAEPLSFARGRLIYSKDVNGVVQLFLYDTNVSSPAPVQLTTFAAADKKLLFAQTDGRHVAILRGDAAGQNRDITLLGGLTLTDANTQPIDAPPNQQVPFQLQRGQLLWTAQNSSVIYFDGQNFGRVCTEGFLADGFIAQLRKSSTTGPDTEVWLATGTPPNDADQPSPPLLVRAATQANGQSTITWDTILGATGYVVYFAQQSGVNKSNFASLPGGGSVNVASPTATILNLKGNAQYFFAVAAVEGSTEGPVSREASVTPCADPASDGDADGTPDCQDGCPTDPAKTEPGVCGCGTPETDTDGDGTPDCTDGCPNDPAQTDPAACPDETPVIDTDGDGIPDTPADGTDGGVGPAQEDGETPGPARCGAGTCGPGSAAILPLALMALALMKTRATRRPRRRA